MTLAVPRRRSVGPRMLAAVLTLVGMVGLVLPAAPAAAAAQMTWFPVDSPCAYIDTFGAPRSGGRVHEGTDVIAASGVPLRAVLDGTVSRISVNTLGGNALYVTAPDGTYYYYAHLSAYAAGLYAGQRVSAGDLLGYVGMTGNAPIPHLHFEVHPGGGPAVNPYPLLRALGGCGYTPTGTTTTTTSPPTTIPTTTAPPVTTVPGSTGTLQAGSLTSMATTRVVDTRFGLRGSRVASGSTTIYDLSSHLPAGAGAAQLTVWASGPASDGYLVAYPCGATRPPTSTVNFTTGSVIGATTVVGTPGRKVCVFSSSTTDVIIDATASAGVSGSGFVPTTPARVLDSRYGAPVPGGTVRGFRVAGVNGVSPSATEVTVNVTTLGATRPGSVQVYACGSSAPGVPVVLSVPGLVKVGGATVRVGTSGTICVVPSVTAHVIVDVTASWLPGGSNVTPIVPARLLDTRATVPARAFVPVTVPVAGRNGVPWGAKAAAVTVTAAEPQASLYVTVYPCGMAPPRISMLNTTSGVNLATGAFVGLGAGSVCVMASQPTDLIVDVTGWA